MPYHSRFALALCAGFSDMRSVAGAEVLLDSEIEFLQDLVQAETDKFKWNTLQRLPQVGVQRPCYQPAAKVKDSIDRLFDDRQKEDVGTSLAPRKAIKRLAETLNDDASRRRWLEAARIDALIMNCQMLGLSCGQRKRRQLSARGP